MHLIEYCGFTSDTENTNIKKLQYIATDLLELYSQMMNNKQSYKSY